MTSAAGAGYDVDGYDATSPCGSNAGLGIFGDPGINVIRLNLALDS